eukprot:Rhum_TRINITY_DN14439_c8_g1::Rhum_TRINITY_DN14439_c8_g1_i1::g.92053::m.92053
MRPTSFRRASQRSDHLRRRGKRPGTRCSRLGHGATSKRRRATLRLCLRGEIPLPALQPPALPVARHGRALAGLHKVSDSLACVVLRLRKQCMQQRQEGLRVLVPRQRPDLGRQSECGDVRRVRAPPARIDRHLQVQDETGVRWRDAQRNHVRACVRGHPQRLLAAQRVLEDRHPVQRRCRPVPRGDGQHVAGRRVIRVLQALQHNSPQHTGGKGFLARALLEACPQRQRRVRRRRRRPHNGSVHLRAPAQLQVPLQHPEPLAELLDSRALRVAPQQQQRIVAPQGAARVRLACALQQVAAPPHRLRRRVLLGYRRFLGGGDGERRAQEADGSADAARGGCATLVEHAGDAEGGGEAVAGAEVTKQAVSRVALRAPIKGLE